MSIQDIEASLPNGLHDAVLRRYVVDYETRSASLSFEVWIGDVDSEEEPERECTRPGTLSLRGLAYFVVEPPGPESPLAFEPPATSAGDPVEDEVRPAAPLPAAPEGTFRAYFFLHSMNAFIHLCAAEAQFSFDEDAA